MAEVKELKQAVDYFQSGYELHNQGKFKEAIEDYTKAIKLDPKYVDAYFNRGLAWFKIGSFDNAITDYTESIRLDSGAPDAYCNRGFAWHEKGEYDKAIDDYTEAIRLDDHYKSAYLNRGLAKSQKKEYQEAIQDYNKTIALDENYAVAYYNRGLAFHNKREYDEAIQDYNKAIELDPSYVTAFNNRGLALYNKKEYEEAIKDYNKAIELDKNYLLAYNNRGLVFYVKQDYDEAIKDYNKAIELDPNYALAYYNRGLAKSRKREFDDAIRDYTRAIQLDSNYPNAYLSRGLAYFDQEDFSNAVENYSEAIKLNSTNPSGYYNRAIALYEMEKYDEAIQDYSKAILLNAPDSYFYAYSYYGRGLARYRKKEYELALQDYKKSIELDPKYESAYNEFYLLCKEQGKLSEAVLYFKSLISPTSSLFVFNYCCYALADEKKYDEAIALLERLVKMGKATAREYYELGATHLNNLTYEKAKVSFDKSLSLNPSFVSAQHNKSWIYEKLGDYVSAKTEWHRTIQMYKKQGADEQDNPYPQNSFFLAEVLFNSLQSEEYDKIESLYQNAIHLNEQNANYHLALVRFYKVLKQEAADKNDPGDQKIRNHAHSKMLDAFRQGTQILKKNIEDRPNKYTFSTLGEFYLNAERYDDAIEYFEKALQADEEFAFAYTGLGVAQVKKELYKTAITNFICSLNIDPDDLNVQSNLGDAYRKAEMYEKSEEIYRNILSQSEYYIDAFIGLAECFKIRGDKSIDDKDYDKAAEYFIESIKFLEKAVENQGKDKASKRLSNAEQSALFYSKGYCKVRLFEIKKFDLLSLKDFNFLSLLSAEKDFCKIGKDQAEYFKARNTIRKIRAKRWSVLSAKTIAPAVIFLMSAAFFVVVQYLFLGKMLSQKNIYTLNKNAVYSLIRENKLDSVGKKITVLFDSSFTSVAQLNNAIEQFIPSDYLNQKQIPALINQEKINEKEGISEVGYGFFTFGSLIFMVVGLFLGDITRLKVGSIQMDKNAVENVSTSISLGVSTSFKSSSLSGQLSRITSRPGYSLR
jgi:tetratricopeptide (TPR) repeat protein